MALQPDPANRPQSMAEFILRLNSDSVSTGGDQFEPIEEPVEEKTTIALKPKESSTGGGGLLASLPGGLGQNKIALIGIGAVALVLLLVLTVVLTSFGGEEEVPSRGPIVDAAPDNTGEGSSPQRQLDVGSPQFARLAATAAANVECAWLSFDGASGSTARFKGGAANPAEAQTLLAGALESAGASSPALDFSNVVRFSQQYCPAINAMRAARSDQPLITTPQSSYEALRQSIAVDGGTLEEASYAKALVQVQNVQPGEEIALITFDAAGGLFAFTQDRSETNEYIKFLQGDATASGFQVNYPAELSDGRERGLIVVTSPQPLPKSLINTAAGQNPEFDEGWANDFSQGARANGWKVDAVWFTVEDRQPG